MRQAYLGAFPHRQAPNGASCLPRKANLSGAGRFCILVLYRGHERRPRPRLGVQLF